MTFREMNLRVFQRRPVPHVFFQPRFEPWLAWHQEFGGLPPEIRDMSLPEVYDYVGASMRTVHYYSGQPDPVVQQWKPDVRVEHKREGEHLFVRYDTPFGSLHETLHWTVDKTWRKVEFAAKRLEDMRALRWLLEHRDIHFSRTNFETGASFVGDRGEPQFWVPKSPYLALAQQWMKYEDFIYALADAPRVVEDVMRVIDASYDALYEELTEAAGTLLHILNFGENVAMAYLSTRYYEEYLLPWYHKRSGQLRRAGIFTHIHIDGYFRGLLPYLSSMPFDGLEALTPLPQGDVSIAEMAEAVGDKILLDGIPAVLFLPTFPREELERCVEEIVERFHPRLVLGISDELPEAGDEESFARLCAVARWCRTGTWQY